MKVLDNTIYIMFINLMRFWENKSYKILNNK